MTTRKSGFITATMLALSLAASANLAPKAVAAAAEGQTLAMARVWFLRPAGSLNGNVWAAAPIIYANGAPVGNIRAGTEFYRDFPPEDLQVYGAALRAADRSDRYRIAGARLADLSANPMGGQLAVRLSGGRLGVQA